MQPQNTVESRQDNIEFELDRNRPKAAVEAGAQGLEEGGLKILKNAHLPCPPQEPIRVVIRPSEPTPRARITAMLATRQTHRPGKMRKHRFRR